MNDLQRILNMLVRMDAHDARKVRDMADGRLRELGELKLEAHLFDAESLPYRQPTAHQPVMSEQQKQIADEVVADYRDELLARREGLELQRGLEVAVERERERLDGSDGPDASGPHSGLPRHEGALNECPACEDEGHVGQTDVF